MTLETLYVYLWWLLFSMLGQVYNVKQVCSVFYKSKMVLIQKLIPKLTKSLSFLCHFQVYPGSESGFLTTQFLITRYKVS